MGATDFTSVSTGKTPQEAFERARENAGWERGWGGYSGTIVEKSGFVLFDLPPRISLDKLEGWVMECKYLLYDTEEPYDLRWAREAVATAKPGTKRDAQKHLRKVEERIKVQEKERAKFEREVGSNLGLVRKMADVYGDKWGPACCVELRTPGQRKPYLYAGKPQRGERMFLFFGIASC